MKILLEKLKGKLKDSNAGLIISAPVLLLAMFSMPVLGIISGRICKEAAYESGSVFGVAIALAICFGIVYETTIGFGEVISYSHRYGIAAFLLLIYISFAVFMNNSMIKSEREEQEKKTNSKFY